MPQLIHNWEELARIHPESDTHVLEVRVERGNAWLRCKDERLDKYDPKGDYIAQAHFLSHYLSTHAFYGHQYRSSTAILQACGFDVELCNWDTLSQVHNKE